MIQPLSLLVPAPEIVIYEVTTQIGDGMGDVHRASVRWGTNAIS